jgi:hypothetical protein
MASGVTAVDISSDAVIFDVAGTECTIYGWSIVNSGTAGQFMLRANSATGQILANQFLAATTGNSQVWLGPQGLKCKGDLFFDYIAGTLAGVVWVG